MPRSRRNHAMLVQIGRRLRSARLALEMDQTDAYKAVNVGKSTWSMWETGQRLADPLAMIRFARQFGITLDWIYLGNASGLPHEVRNRILFHQASTPAGE